MEVRDFILQQTFGLLLRKGYNGVSVSDIQVATRMARGLLYYYYGNQERLFEGAVEKYLDRWMLIEKEKLKNKSLTDLMVCFVERHRQTEQELRESCGHDLCYADLRILFLETARHHAAFAQAYQSICTDRYTIWKTGVLNSFALGEFRSGLNLESVARHCVYIEDSVTLNLMVGQAYCDVGYILEKAFGEFFEIIRR